MLKDKGFIGIILAIILLFLLQQQILTQQQVIGIAIILALAFLIFSKDDIKNILSKQNSVPYSFPNVSQEYTKIRNTIMNDHNRGIILGDLIHHMGEPEFGITANQPAVMHYIAEYYDLKTKYKVKKICRITQSVIHKDKVGAGITSTILTFKPMENLNYSLSGAKKFPAEKGEKFYNVTPQKIIPIDTDENVVDAEFDEQMTKKEEEIEDER